MLKLPYTGCVVSDPVCPERYHCSHGAGLHSLVLPWIEKFQHFCESGIHRLQALMCLLKCGASSADFLLSVSVMALVQNVKLQSKETECLSLLCWHCWYSMLSRICETVLCPSICACACCHCMWWVCCCGPSK